MLDHLIMLIPRTTYFIFLCLFSELNILPTESKGNKEDKMKVIKLGAGKSRCSDDKSLMEVMFGDKLQGGFDNSTKWTIVAEMAAITLVFVVIYLAWLTKTGCCWSTSYQKVQRSKSISEEKRNSDAFHKPIGRIHGVPATCSYV